MDVAKSDTYIDFFENSPLAQLIADQTGIVLHANAAALALLGYDETTAGELLGHRCTKLFAQKGDAHSLIAAVSRNRVITAQQTAMLNREKQPITVLVNASASFSGKTFNYTRLYLQDITGSVLCDPIAQLGQETLRILVEASSIQDAMEQLVPVFARGLKCDIGLVWKADEKVNRLERLVFFREGSSVGPEHLLSKSNNISLILASGFPADSWFSDRAQNISADSNRVCCGAAIGEALPGCTQIISFPIPIGRLNWGLFGFFSTSEKQIGPDILSVLEKLGRQIGRFVERQEALENYQKLQESYALAIAGANDGIWDWNLTTNEAYFSPRYKSLLGFEDRELENHFDTFRKLAHPDDYPLVMDAVHKHMITREPYEVEIRMLAKSGEYRWINSRGNCTFNEQGQPVRMSGSHRDITDLKEAEMARHRTEMRLLESETKFRQLAENIREVFFIVTADRRFFTYVSPAFEDFWGVSCAEIYKDASLFFDAMLDEDCLRIRQALAKSIDPSGNEFEFRMVKKDDPAERLRWIRAKLFPVVDDKGVVSHLCGIAYDITDKKETENQANQFYSTISHELRTPLTSIRAALGLIENGLTGKIPDETLEYTTIARDNCDRLIRLINDMLDIQKIEANHLELNLQPLLARKVVTKTVDSLKPYAEESGVSIDAAGLLKVELSHFYGDSDRVVQILTNLISNAIKYTPKGKSVLVSASETDHETVRFSVRDKGRGISEKDKADLFGPFQQLSCIENQVNRGTGLGLAITKILVERQDGFIGVNSKIGEGSEFWFELPACAAEKEVKKITSTSNFSGKQNQSGHGDAGGVIGGSANPSTTKFSSSSSSSSSGDNHSTNRTAARSTERMNTSGTNKLAPRHTGKAASKREAKGTGKAVLVLEDSDSIAMIINAFLVKNGYAVTRAATIAEAKKSLSSANRPAMIIADVHLPDGSGLKFIDWVRDAENGSQPKTPVIFLSGGEIEAAELGKQNDVDWVQKPFDGPQLVDLVCRRIGKN